jgi:uncharacterized protein GlcG (DUF336 family)
MNSVRLWSGKGLAAVLGWVGLVVLTVAFVGVPANDGLRDMDERLVIQAGGLPIRIGGALVGGIGVGGAPSGDIDASCARAGLDKIGAA